MSPAALPFLLAAAACLASAIGGYATLRLGERIGPVFGVCAGILTGVALLDILPEAWRLCSPAWRGLVPVATLGGGVAVLLIHGAVPALARGAGLARHVGPASLTLHSLTDGLGIGLGFKLSPEIGWTIAAGILAHDMADGVNVVGLSLAGGDRRVAARWLIANSVAPLVGVGIAQVLRIAQGGLALVVATLAGIFLVIAARELLPRSVRLIGPARTAVAWAIGVAFVYAWVGLEP